MICGKSPGGALRIEIEKEEQTRLVMHDGSMLSGVSSALKLGRKVVLGGPESHGLLVCDL